MYTPKYRLHIPNPKFETFGVYMYHKWKIPSLVSYEAVSGTKLCKMVPNITSGSVFKSSMKHKSIWTSIPRLRIL